MLIIAGCWKNTICLHFFSFMFIVFFNHVRTSNLHLKWNEASVMWSKWGAGLFSNSEWLNGNCCYSCGPWMQCAKCSNTYHGSKGRTMRQGSELCLHSFRWSDRGFGLVVLKSDVCYQTKPNSYIKSIWKNRRELTTWWKLLACINYPFRRSLTLIVVSKVLPSLSSD